MAVEAVSSHDALVFRDRQRTWRWYDAIGPGVVKYINEFVTAALVSGDPRIDNPTRERMFDTSKFTRFPAFARRTNPLQYPGVTGPGYSNIDLTLAKSYPITERLKLELRMESYNFTNSFTGANPVLNVNSSLFGRVVAQRGGIYGRQFQYSGRLIW